MLIKELRLDPSTEEKIVLKHGIMKCEIEEVLFWDEPKYFKARNERYMAIGFSQRPITIIFEYADGIANAVTSYPTSKWQRKLYERK